MSACISSNAYQQGRYDTYIPEHIRDGRMGDLHGEVRYQQLALFHAVGPGLEHINTCPRQVVSGNRDSRNILPKISAYLSAHENPHPLSDTPCLGQVARAPQEKRSLDIGVPEGSWARWRERI